MRNRISIGQNSQHRSSLVAIVLILFVVLLLFALNTCSSSPEISSSKSKPSSHTVEEDSGTSGEEGVRAEDSDADEPSPSVGDAAAVSNETEAKETLEEDEAGPPPSPAEKGRTAKALSGGRPSSSGLKAGYADDNRQFGYFVQFLEKYASVFHIPIPIEERIIFTVKDKNDKSIANAKIQVISEESGRLLAEGKSYADGRFLFFPSEYTDAEKSFIVRTTVNQAVREKRILRDGPRSVDLSLPHSRLEAERVPLDILFVLDTTGSMGEEIQRLKTTIELIHLNFSNLSADPLVRFGMVLYKDRGDEDYVTKRVPLTADLERFQSALAEVKADGGGDTPEDLQAALDDTVNMMSWNRDGIRLAFIITDAPPHLDYGQEYDYSSAVRDARKKGIKFFSVGTGGLDIQGEYILRQIAQYTAGKYIFLTYGEQGESEGGKVGSVSHHTGANFQTDKLEAIIIRLAKEELSYLTDKPLEMAEDYFEAVKTEDEEREETLAKLFHEAFSQLLDFSSYRIEAATTAALLPLSPRQEHLAVNAEYFSQAMLLQAATNASFTLVERQELQKILEELELQVSGLMDEENARQIGELLGAEILFTGELYERKGKYEVFIKMLRVQTGEILSVTKAIISKELGL